jgi:hypothetical protein
MGHFTQTKSNADVIQALLLSIHLTRPQCPYNLGFVENVRYIKAGVCPYE